MAKPNWISLSKSSGTGGGSVNVTASSNSNTHSRSGTITVKTASGLTKMVSVSQAAAQPIVVNFDLPVINGLGGNKPIDDFPLGARGGRGTLSVSVENERLAHQEGYIELNGGASPYLTVDFYDGKESATSSIPNSIGVLYIKWEVSYSQESPFGNYYLNIINGATTYKGMGSIDF